MKLISDGEWFDANLHPQCIGKNLGIQIPDLPPSEVQMRFYREGGTREPPAGFRLYEFVLAKVSQDDIVGHRLLDFGGGGEHFALFSAGISGRTLDFG